MFIKTILKKIVPSKLVLILLPFYKPFGRVLLKYELKKIRKKQYQSVEKLKIKHTINVIFFLINTDTWKLNSVYEAFKNRDNYNPIVVICPLIGKGNDFLDKEMSKAENYCKKKKYNHTIAYDTLRRQPINIKSLLKPDIIFFTNPNNITHKEFLIDNYLDKLTCFIPYSFRIDKLYEYEYNNRLVNLTWMNFYETQIHKELAEKHADNNGRNVEVSGFPFLDKESKNKSKISVWKHQDKKKKIIWAPHWTIKGYQPTGLDWSCFLDYYQFIIDLAIEFNNEIQFAIKPHPFLKTLLSEENLWGRRKTEEYFKKWNTINNCQYINGDYKDFFDQSDALIHDSGSFMSEYMIQNKPIGYTVSDKPINERFNKFGEVVLTGHQLIYDKKDFRKFILDVINNVDGLKIEREIISKNHQLTETGFIGEKIVDIINKKLT